MAGRGDGPVGSAPVTAVSAARMLALVISIAALAVVGCTNPLRVESDGPGDDGAQSGLGEPSADEPSADESSADEVGGATEPPPGAEVITIDRVIDGDSLEVFLADGRAQEVRLEGINAPELNALGGGRTCAGEAARDELVELLGSGQVTLTGQELDRFDRLLVRLQVDGRPVDQALVAAGWALALWSAEDPDLTDAMMTAAEAERGWWGSECGAPEAEGLRIGDTQANAPGDDRENLDQEWVELVNDGTSPVELEGWVLRDETTSNRFPFPTLTLAPGATLRVITGSGSSGEDRLSLGERFPVWSNGGDTVLLIDPAGVVATHAFI